MPWLLGYVTFSFPSHHTTIGIRCPAPSIEYFASAAPLASSRGSDMLSRFPPVVARASRPRIPSRVEQAAARLYPFSPHARLLGISQIVTCSDSSKSQFG